MKSIKYILIIGIVCFVISKFFVSICVVHGSSMSPTYKDKSIVLESKIITNINRNDIVVIKKNNLKIVKRIIGIPNDKIVVKDGYIYINKKKYNDLYINDPGLLINEVILGKEEYFLLGDNIDNSIDSRFSEIGIIKKEEIKGKIIR